MSILLFIRHNANRTRNNVTWTKAARQKTNEVHAANSQLATPINCNHAVVFHMLTPQTFTIAIAMAYSEAWWGLNPRDSSDSTYICVHGIQKIKATLPWNVQKLNRFRLQGKGLHIAALTSHGSWTLLGHRPRHSFYSHANPGTFHLWHILATVRHCAGARKMTDMKMQDHRNVQAWNLRTSKWRTWICRTCFRCLNRPTWNRLRFGGAPL